MMKKRFINSAFVFMAMSLCCLSDFGANTGEWFVLRTSSNFPTFFALLFGTNGDIPIVKRGA
jgi:hypothetical protein